MSDWITDRLPTEEDGDKDGDVDVQCRPDSEYKAFMHWTYVRQGVPWKRTAWWALKSLPELGPAPEPDSEPAPDVAESTPRRFVSISRTILKDGDHILDAIDDEGIAWWKRLDTSPHHPAFHVPEPEWQRLTELPAREVPADA